MDCVLGADQFHRTDIDIMRKHIAQSGKDIALDLSTGNWNNPERVKDLHHDKITNAIYRVNFDMWDFWNVKGPLKTDVINRF